VASAPEARGRGAGYAVVRAMEADLRRRGARLLRIETSSLTEYGPARQFYARLDYREAARIRDFYRPGDDLVILTSRL
jgi:ribosomal protein S18 acetylase RimI-like enzyme